MSKSWKIDRQKNGIFRVQFSTTEGRRVRKSLSTRDHTIARKAAEKFYREQCERDLAGPPKEIRYFYEYAMAYMENGGEQRFMAKLLNHFGMDADIDKIGELEMTQAALAICPDRSPATWQRNVYTPIKAVINFANGKQRKKSTDVKRTRWLTPEEFERLYECADHRTRQKICFLVGTGCRTGEMFALDMQNFWPATAQARIVETKNGDERIVQLPQRAMALLTDMPDVGAVFRTPKGLPYQLRASGGGQMAAAFNRARDAAGLDRDVTPHVLRHTWATWYYSQTRDFGGLLDLGGWRKADMANRYRKIAPADLSDRLLKHNWDFWQEFGKVSTQQPHIGRKQGVF